MMRREGFWHNLYQRLEDDVDNKAEKTTGTQVVPVVAI